MPQHSETILQHLGEEEHILGAVVPPIFQNSLFVQESCDAWIAALEGQAMDHYVYSRVSNPTLSVLEKKIAFLEGAEACKVFGSGMGAISAAIFSTVQAGSHVVCVDTVYGPTRSLLESYLTKFQVQTTFVDGRSTEAIFDAVRPETTLIYLESPSSILFQIQDLARVGSFARERGISTIIDNTYSAGLLQRPHEHGIDLVCHTGSKYFGGHSDLIAGVITGSAERLKVLGPKEYELMGGALAPFVAWLMLRGLRTLSLRLQRHGQTATRVAPWLEAHPQVERVWFPGLDSFPQKDLADRQLSGVGGLITFQPRVQDVEHIKAIADRCQLFQRGVSWGGFESLIVPIPMQNAEMPEKTWLIRIFCGLEHPEDMIADLEQALQI